MRFDQIVMYLVFILWGASSSFQNNEILLVIEKMDHSSLASLIGSDSSMSMQSTEESIQVDSVDEISNGRSVS